MATKVIYSFLFIIIAFQISFGQMICGSVETPDFINRLKKNIREVDNNTRDGEIIYLPINFINVANDNGTGRLNKTRLYKELCHINKVYSVNDVQFYLHENTINELDHETVYENAVENPSLLLNYKESGTINIFIVNNATSAGSLGVTLGYFWPGFDYIVMLKTRVGVDGNTLPHELGHFFSLPHTFRGWDHDPWNEEDHGSIVGNFSPGGTLNEKVDGSNCASAGDLICDTPADYNLGFGYQGECNNYLGNCHDPSGVLLAPMEENFMGYFNTCHPETFTPMQGDIIAQDIQNRINDGSLIEGEDLADLAIDVDEYNYIYPALDGVSTFYDDITFEWDDIENADSYFFQLDRIPTFSFNPIFETLNTQTINITSLTADKKYYWKVWPLNKYATCPLRHTNATFRTGILNDATDIHNNNNISFYPNPIKSNQTLVIDLPNLEIETIEIKDNTARTIISVSVKKTTDNVEINLTKYNIPSGIYIIDFVGDNFRNSKKLIVD